MAAGQAGDELEHLLWVCEEVGQEQRVAIARALVADPSLLVADEPTGDLDRESADEILELLQDLSTKQKKTILMVTHDPKAADHASKKYFLDKGRILNEL